MTRSASDLRDRRPARVWPDVVSPQALANEPYVSESFGEFPLMDSAWSPLSDPFAHSHQTAHDDFRPAFIAADEDEEVEDDELFDDEGDDDLLDDDEEDDDDDFFDDDEDDFDDDDDDEAEDEDEDSYFLGDDD